MKIFRATLIVALVALILTVDSAVFVRAESDEGETTPAPFQYKNKKYRFRFYPLQTWKQYTETGMRALLQRADFKCYGSGTLGFTAEEIEAGRAVFFGDIKRNPRADIGRFERLKYLGVAFGEAEEIGERYDRITGRTTAGGEGAVYFSYTETSRTVTVDKGGSDEDRFGDDPMTRKSKTTYTIRLRIYYIELPKDKAAMLTFGCRGSEAETYFADAERWIKDKFVIIKPKKEENTKTYENTQFGFSFKIDKDWREMDASDLSVSRVFINFASPKAVEDGRVIFFAASDDTIDLENDIWAAPTLMIVIHDESPHVDEDFRKSREDKISNEMTYMRRTGPIVSRIEDIEGVRVCRVEVTGEAGTDKQKITQVFYFLPLGTKGATFMFSFPESAGYSKDEINAVVRGVRSTLEGVKPGKAETDAVYYLVSVFALIVGAAVFFFFRIRARMKRMEGRQNKGTYRHTGFKPKDLTLKPKKPSGPASSDSAKKPPQGRQGLHPNEE